MTSDEFSNIEQLDENLRKWFKEKWVRFGPDGKIRGACARGDDSEGKPKCLPQKKAQNLGKKGRKYAASKKRREDPNPERTGKAKNVATKKKTDENAGRSSEIEIPTEDGITMQDIRLMAGEGKLPKKTVLQAIEVIRKQRKSRNLPESVPFDECPKCRGPIVHESMMNEKQDACYHKVKSRYKVWPSAYASGALVQCRKKGASNWGTGGKKSESSIMKGIVDEAGSAAQQAAIAISKKERGEKPKHVDEAKAKQYVKPYNDPQTGEQIGWVSSDGYHKKYWQKFAKNSAIKHAKLNPDEVDEAYTGQFAAEKTPKINPYGGLKDNQFRGAISETPTDNPTGASGEGGLRKYRPKSAGTFTEDELDEACWKGYHKEGNKKMFGKTYPNCVKNTNEEAVDEGLGDSIKKTALGIGTAAALAASPAQAKTPDVPNAPVAPVAAQQAQQPSVFKEKLHITSKAAKKYGLSDLYNDIFSPGQDEETLLKNIKKIHDGRPAELGEKVGSLELIPSDRNDADYIARVNYQNGRLDIYLQKGGMLKSVLVPSLNNVPTGKKKKYIMLWANWTIGSPQEKKPMDFESTQLDEKCWDSHKQVGMKNKGGRQVPNCVPKESSIMKGLKSL